MSRLPSDALFLADDGDIRVVTGTVDTPNGREWYLSVTLTESTAVGRPDRTLFLYREDAIALVDALLRVLPRGRGVR